MEKAAAPVLAVLHSLNAFVLQAENFQVGPVLSVGALYASAFHPSSAGSRGGTGRMLAQPPLCAGRMKRLVETLLEPF